jgi:hypothetical protein
MPILLDSFIAVMFFSGVCILSYEATGYLIRHIQIKWKK